jgi:hypothetical protein
MIYEALSNIRHNGVTYEAGQIVDDLGEEAAKSLLEAKVIVAKEEQKVEQAAAQPPAPDGFPVHETPKPPANNVPPVQPQPQSQPAPSQPNVPTPGDNQHH